jgi:hypothetical protein
LVLLHALFTTMATELDAAGISWRDHGWRRPCAGAGGALCALRHSAPGRHCARDGGRGCGGCGALHRYLAWG